MLDSQSWGKTILRNVVGFTLAEVLITIAVIGVIAAIVIPSLLKNTNGRETVVALNKYQSVFSEAVKRYMVDNGCNGDLSKCDAFSGDSDHNRAGTALIPYFNVQKMCGIAANHGCWTPGLTYKRLNNTNDFMIRDASLYYKAILNDGVSIQIADININGNCNADVSVPTNPSSPLYNSVCGHFTIDINGHKSPNKWGRDVFALYILKTGQIIPYGAFDDVSRGCDPNSSDVDCTATNCNTISDPACGCSGIGYGCTYKVLHEGAVNY